MKKKKTSRLEDQLYIVGLCLPFAVAAFFMTEKALHALLGPGISVPCMFHAVTGFYCPGCGGTRAFAALMEGKILLSLFYHPVVPYCTALYAWFMVSHTIERALRHLPHGVGKGDLLSERRIGMAYRNGYLYAALAVVIINAAAKDIALAAFHVDILKILDAHVLI